MYLKILEGRIIMLVYYKESVENEYYTIALAYQKCGWNSKIVIYNPRTNSIVVEKLWKKFNNKTSRCAFIIDDTTDVKYKKWLGYSSIINDIKNRILFSKIKFSEDSLELAKKLYSRIEIQDWFEIKNEQQLITLQNTALGFHDANIKKTKDLSDGKRILIDTTWDCLIELKCIDIVEYDIKFDLQFEYYSTSDLYIDDNLITLNFKLGFCNDDREYDIISCKKLYWRLKF